MPVEYISAEDMPRGRIPGHNLFSLLDEYAEIKTFVEKVATGLQAARPVRVRLDKKTFAELSADSKNPYAAFRRVISRLCKTSKAPFIVRLLKNKSTKEMAIYLEPLEPEKKRRR